MSIASDGTPANADSDLAAVSPDGRFVAFWSSATNLAAGDTNGSADIFVHDRLTRITTRESVSSSGVQGNANSYAPSISADGRYVAFYSFATNLASVAVSRPQIYVRDRTLGVTILASVSNGGTPAAAQDTGSPSISANGRFVSFESSDENLVAGDPNGKRDIFTRDLVSGTTTRDSVASNGTQADGHSFEPSLSSDGRYVVFHSWAHNLVVQATGFDEVFVHDRLTGQTTLESVSDAGAQLNGNLPAPSISADGRFVAFKGFAVGLYLRDRLTAHTLATAAPAIGFHRLSPDGRFLTFAGAGGTVAVYDQLTGQSMDLVTGLVPVAANTAVAFATITALAAEDVNGQVDIYVLDGSLAQTGVPGPPTTLTNSVGVSSVTLTWHAPTTGGAPTTYILEASRGDGAHLATISTGSTATSFSAGGLGNGEYVVRVRAANADGTSAPTNDARFLIGPFCLSVGPPANLSAAVSGSSVTLTWTAGARAFSYQLHVGSAPGASDLLAVDLVSRATSLFAPDVPAGTYFVRVSSLNPCGQPSAASNEAVVIVP